MITTMFSFCVQGLFIAILFFSCLAAFLVIMCRVLRSSANGKSKYQVKSHSFIISRENIRVNYREGIPDPGSDGLCAVR